MNHLHLLAPAEYQDIPALFTAALASVRLRLAPLARAAISNHITVTIGDRIPTAATIIYVGKPHGTSTKHRDQKTEGWRAEISRAISRGRRVFVDYTDDHCDADSPFHQPYDHAFSLGAAAVTSSVALAEKLRGDYGVEHIQSVEDWVEHHSRPPYQKDNPVIKALWFGHETNIISLVNALECWPRSVRPTELTVCTSRSGLTLLKRLGATSPNLHVKFLDWSPLTVASVAEQSDYCLVTAETNGPKRFASNNRLVTSLNLGLPTIATPLKSYSEFSNFFLPLSNASITQATSNPASLFDAVTAFQSAYSERFSLENISLQWSAAILY